jgi:hypothetical protein
MAFTVVLAGVTVLLVTSTYKPVALREDSGAFVDGKPAPTTIAGLKAHADAVLLVTYSGQHRTLPCERPYCLTSSLYAFEIREILKSHSELPNGRRRFRLKLIGGIEESPTLVTYSFVWGRRDPLPLHRYVIFARRWENAWIPATGHAGGKDSIYDVTVERARSLSTEEWDNTSPPLSRELLDELRHN